MTIAYEIKKIIQDSTGSLNFKTSDGWVTLNNISVFIKDEGYQYTSYATISGCNRLIHFDTVCKLRKEIFGNIDCGQIIIPKIEEKPEIKKGDKIIIKWDTLIHEQEREVYEKVKDIVVTVYDIYDNLVMFNYDNCMYSIFLSKIELVKEKVKPNQFRELDLELSREYGGKCLLVKNTNPNFFLFELEMLLN